MAKAKFIEGQHIWLKPIAGDDPDYATGFDIPAQRAEVLEYSNGCIMYCVHKDDRMEGHDDGLGECDPGCVDTVRGAW